jgi:hypothetical protein
MLFAMLLNASAAELTSGARVVALAEAVGAFGQHAQGAEVAAEDEPDELQHEEQRHRDDLQLLHELVPEPVVGLGRGHGRIEPAVAHAPRRDLDRVFGALDRGDLAEPARRVQQVGLVLGDELAAVLVGPLEALDLALLHLVVEQLADHGVLAQDRLVGDERRHERERLVQLALEARRMFGRPLRHEERRLNAAAGDDRDSHREHQAGDKAPVLPESNAAHMAYLLGRRRYFTCVVR